MSRLVANRTLESTARCPPALRIDADARLGDGGVRARHVDRAAPASPRCCSMRSRGVMHVQSEGASWSRATDARAAWLEAGLDHGADERRRADRAAPCSSSRARSSTCPRGPLVRRRATLMPSAPCVAADPRHARSATRSSLRARRPAHDRRMGRPARAVGPHAPSRVPARDGLSFRRWREQARLLLALKRLARREGTDRRDGSRLQQPERVLRDVQAAFRRVAVGVLCVGRVLVRRVRRMPVARTGRAHRMTPAASAPRSPMKHTHAAADATVRT